MLDPVVVLLLLPHLGFPQFGGYFRFGFRRSSQAGQAGIVRQANGPGNVAGRILRPFQNSLPFFGRPTIGGLWLLLLLLLCRTCCCSSAVLLFIRITMFIVIIVGSMICLRCGEALRVQQFLPQGHGRSIASPRIVAQNHGVPCHMDCPKTDRSLLLWLYFLILCCISSRGCCCCCSTCQQAAVVTR